MQNDAIKAPENCGSMAELRVAIDGLDQELVALLARRQAYIERAAILKQDRGTVRDQARIEDVIAQGLHEYLSRFLVQTDLLGQEIRKAYLSCRDYSEFFIQPLRSVQMQ